LAVLTALRGVSSPYKKGSAETNEPGAMIRLMIGGLKRRGCVGGEVKATIAEQAFLIVLGTPPAFWDPGVVFGEEGDFPGGRGWTPYRRVWRRNAQQI